MSMANESTRKLPPGSIVRHFKGKLYKIICEAEHTEEGSKLVIYQALSHPFKVYAKPYKVFYSKVNKEKHPDIEQRYKFEIAYL